MKKRNNAINGWFNKHYRLLSTFGLGMVIGLLVGSPITFAAIPDSNGTIHACRNTAFATVRIIDSPSDTCGAGETALSWNSASAGQLVSNLVGADLTGASLSYRHIAAQDMHDSIIAEANLNGANLAGTNLSTSTISGENAPVLAKNTNFTNTNFNGATITGTIELAGANLSGATFNNATWANSTIFNGDFRNANLANTKLNGTFETANFGGVSFTNVQTFSPLFNSSNLANTSYSGMTLGQTSQFNYSVLSNANFTDATVSAIFRYSTMGSANFTGAEFNGADLRLTDFSGAVLTNTTWTNTMCPDGTNSDNNSNTCVGHLVP